MATWITDKDDKRVQTADAVATTIWSYTLPANTVAYVFVKIEARRASDGAGSVYSYSGAAKRVAGVAVQIGGTSGFSRHEDFVVSAAFGVSGNDVILQVTGIAATTIDWRARLEIEYYTP